MQAIKFEPKYAKRLNTMQAVASAPDRRTTRRARRVSEANDPEATGQGQDGGQNDAEPPTPTPEQPGESGDGESAAGSSATAAAAAAAAAAAMGGAPEAEPENNADKMDDSMSKSATMAQLKRGDFLERFLIDRAKVDLALGA